jgi:hypothetical protein
MKGKSNKIKVEKKVEKMRSWREDETITNLLL